ncbi:MAG: hypothetical protein AAGA56_08930 [Myxococcota bacterium]
MIGHHQLRLWAAGASCLLAASCFLSFELPEDTLAPENGESTSSTTVADTDPTSAPQGNGGDDEARGGGGAGGADPVEWPSWADTITAAQPILWWKLDESGNPDGTGGDAVDTAFDGNGGTFTDDIDHRGEREGIGSAEGVGPTGTGVAVFGDNKRIEVVGSAERSLWFLDHRPFTIEVWVNMAGEQGSNSIPIASSWNKGHTDERQAGYMLRWVFRTEPTTFRGFVFGRYIDDDLQNDTVRTPFLIDSSFHHLVATSRPEGEEPGDETSGPSRICIYLDGVGQCAGQASIPLASTTASGFR